ncbi:MAG: protease modulator HflC [Myxococcota bacterium]|nr:protease modulator HflC [Myxococcota bacterium]
MTRLLTLLVLALAVGVVSVWASEIRLPGGYLPSPVIVTNEVEQNILIMPITGSVSEPITEPGWAFAWPMSRVITLDRRLQHLNAVPVDVVIAGGQTLKTDYYAVWRIVEPESFIETFPQFLEDQAFGMNKARARIQESVKGLVGETVGSLKIEQLLQRTDSIEELGARANALLAETGVEIVDVRINRMDLPQQALSAAYEQMREQQHAIARETRVRGERLARELRAAAEKQARATRAEANAFSERQRGNGDAGAARIYADAFNADPEFYAFVRSLEAYRTTLGDKTTLVLSPDHAFFRFLDPAFRR